MQRKADNISAMKAPSKEIYSKSAICNFLLNNIGRIIYHLRYFRALSQKIAIFAY